MSMQLKLNKIALTIALGISAALIAAAGPASAHGRGGGGVHFGGYSGGFVNTIHPIVRRPIVNTIHPIVQGPIVNTIHPIIGTPPIVRDHRMGGYGFHCNYSCPTEGGLSYGTKPAQLPNGYQLPQGGQVRDHRS